MTPDSGHLKIIVIGGGAAGMMAAGQAAQCGAEVLLLEKMSQPGRKIGISGKGRCNLTNTTGLHDFINHFGKNGPFLHQSFARFFSPELLDFFSQHGLSVVTERGGRIFPASGKALDVVRVFRRWLERLNVKMLYDCPVKSIMTEGQAVTGIQADHIYPADRVILCTGGMSYPLTGSTGDGYRIAQALGHTLAPLRPALVPLETVRKFPELDGLSLKNIEVQMLVNGKKKQQMFGEMTFTKSGVSGPVILTMSGTIVDLLMAGKGIVLLVDLKPALSEQQLDQRLIRDFTSRNKEPIASVLRGLLPRELIPLCLQETGLDGSIVAGRILAQDRHRLGSWLKHLQLDIAGYRPVNEAIVTAGGISLKEVDPRTMQSQLISGLYFAGEILDLQADTGGFNLQAAFSTGWVAGRSAAGCSD